jgi:Tol biopolymer transport system component
VAGTLLASALIYADAGVITRVSVSVDGTPNSVTMNRPSISADGRYVAFSSQAANLVSADSNNTGDVFVRDLQTGTTTRVSTGPSGRQATGGSFRPSLSDDGRYVAFSSDATDIVGPDTNAVMDIFVHDREAGTSTRVSVSTAGRQANSYSVEPVISGDGRFVAFTSVASNLVAADTNGATDIFVWDQQTKGTSRVSVTGAGGQANGASARPAISRDGSVVAFSSGASNLVAGDTNNQSDVFVRDRVANQTRRVSVASDGSQSNRASTDPAISADGRFVAFVSFASNLVAGDTNGAWDVFVHDRTTGETSRVSVASDGTQAKVTGLVTPEDRGRPSISADGRFVAFTSTARNLSARGTNPFTGIFIRDRQANTTTVMEPPIDGRNLEPAISGDGRIVAFASGGSNLPGWQQGYRAGIFVYDRLGGLSRISVSTNSAQASDASDAPSVDAAGRLVVFASAAADLVVNDTNGLGDVFLRDRMSGDTTRISVRADGGQLNNGSGNPRISADGRFVAFESAASNVVTGDTNGQGDIFLHDRQTHNVSRVSVATGGTQANGVSVWPAISGDGRYVAFLSYATNLVPNDTNGAADVFLHDRQTQQTTRVSVADDGTQANGDSQRFALSADGKFVAFTSVAMNLVATNLGGGSGIFVRDREGNHTTRVDVATDGTRGAGIAASPAISADGRFVAFQSSAALVTSDTNGTGDVFVHDRQTRLTTRVSVATGGGQAGAESAFPAISADGRFVVFESTASNLVSDDTNGVTDVFLHDRSTGETQRVSVATNLTQATAGDSRLPVISGNGRVVAFQSQSADLVRSDTNAVTDIFVNDRGPW